MSTEVQTPSGPVPAQADPDEVLTGRGSWWRAVITPALALLLAMLVGSLLIIVTNEEVREAARYFFSRPGDTITAAWQAASSAYAALFKGAILDPASLSSGDLSTILRPISETIVYSTPVILTGLSVAFAFRSGLFNIGAQGQMIAGAIVAGYLGFALTLPTLVHIPVAILGGIAGGVLWGGIAGVLKAWRGAHEVIVTIMLNYIALYILSYLLGLEGFQAPPFTQPKSEPIQDTASLPSLLGSDLRANIGFLVALAAAAGVWWLIERSTIGFRLRAVGSNPAAARTAGMSVPGGYALAMVVAGGLAGLAGAMQVLGPSQALTSGIDNGAGFDGITVALLGRGKPLGVVAAGLLFGALRAGGVRMQAETSTPIDLVLILQALTVLFIAAPPLIHAIFRVRTRGGLAHASAKGWN